jgi:ribosomal protein L19
LEHRWGDRTVVNLRVRISTDSLVGDGILRNVSVSGAFIETSLPLVAMCPVQIRVLRRNKHWLSRAVASGFVVRNTQDGVGIEWNELAALPLGNLPAQAPQPALRRRSGKRLVTVS